MTEHVRVYCSFTCSTSFCSSLYDGRTRQGTL